VMGLKPLLETPLKGPYTRNDVRRYARQHGVMLGREPDLAPMNPLTCGRAMAWARQAQPSSATDLARAMLHAYWNAGIDLSSPSSLATIKLPLAISAAELVAATSSAQAAQLLRDEVDASVKSGVFGSPTVSVDGELFWGIDKFDQIQSWLLKGPW
jgi:2-hydroxychromene-2-carboxylate isomerase